MGTSGQAFISSSTFFSHTLYPVSDQISRLCNENPNIIDDHEIMAHGAMISSLILSHYLEECTKKNFILNSCHFMRLGLDRKPDIKYVYFYFFGSFCFLHFGGKKIVQPISTIILEILQLIHNLFDIEME